MNTTINFNKKGNKSLEDKDKQVSGTSNKDILVVPGEVILSPGQEKEFTVNEIDSLGGINQIMPQWSLKNLKGTVSSSGVVNLSKDNIPQAGLIIGVIGSTSYKARISSRPKIPFKEDFFFHSTQKLPL